MARSPRSLLHSSLTLVLFSLALLFALPAAVQAQLTTPQEFLGFNFGDDYHLANYQQISAYWRLLADQSDRMVVREIGTTAEGRTMLMAIISAPENIRNLDRYQQIAKRLALAEGLTDDEARALASDGRAVVWIDGGLHATEVLGAQQLSEMVWQLVSRTDDETVRMLQDDIVLLVHANPDGNDLTADWYNRNPIPELRGNDPGLPRLYHKYIGHDNNRDFFASTQPETEAMNRVMYHEWFPQIVYNHHQSGPAGTIMFAPPFRDPFNYNFDPIVVMQLDLVSAAMHTRFQVEGKPGVTMRTGARYSTWWNGGLRTTAYFHNMVGILTESIGNPTPQRVPYVSRNVLPRGDLPNPIEPQEWHFRQSIDYSITANRAILDIASRNRENFLFNIYRMGKNGIERGSRDSWTITPDLVELANQELERRRPARSGGSADFGGRSRGDGVEGFDAYAEVLHTPETRDARGYIISSDQPDFLTATKFVNALRELNVAVHRATAPFEVGGKRYPSGSYVVFTAQAFRPHAVDMFEPQNHPDDFAYPGAAPTAPYDNAGWTLAYQMGVEFDRILEGFDGPFERIDDWNVQPPAGGVTTIAGAAGYYSDHRVNDAFHAVNALLGDGEAVYRLTESVSVGGKTYPAGTFYVSAGASTKGRLDRLAAEVGVSFEAAAAPAAGSASRLEIPRIGLMDTYGGSMPSGWARWIMEQFGFAYERTFPPRIDRGNLNAQYDVMVFPSGVLPDPSRPSRSRGGSTNYTAAQNDSIEASLPAEYRDQRGGVTPEKTLAAVREFVENGGTAIAIGGSAQTLASYLDLPVTDYLVSEDGEPLSRNEFFVPGSVLRLEVDQTHPLAAGVPSQVDAHFDNSPVFALAPDAESRGVKRVAWFGSASPLRSGWAWGQEHLEGGTAIVEARVGRGRVFLFGPEILERGQTHGTFKFFFNALFRR
jgi:hypothetical protein